MPERAESAAVSESESSTSTTDAGSPSTVQQCCVELVRIPETSDSPEKVDMIDGNGNKVDHHHRHRHGQRGLNNVNYCKVHGKC